MLFTLVFFCDVGGALLVDLLVLDLENILVLAEHVSLWRGYMPSYFCLCLLISRRISPNWYASCLCHLFDLLHAMLYDWSPP